MKVIVYENREKTIVGERGIKLSGGEKQRITIARAILRNAPIIIFDEATSNLDNITEETIMMNLINSFENQTKIIIAHRLSTIRGADIIHVLKEGRVIEEGNHEELMIKKGYYSSLYNIGLSKEPLVDKNIS